MFRLRTTISAMIAAGVALAAVGCGQPKPESMKVGDCGYFTHGQANRSWDFQHRACNDPDAALIVVRAAAKADCADHSFSWKSRGRKGKYVYVCTHLNAQVGDCINDPENHYAHLDRLRKAPCTTPGAYQVNTRVERDEYSVCDSASREHEQTASIRHKQPPVSFCLHRVDA